METELYSIDIQRDGDVMIYGGANDKCTMYDLQNDRIVTIVENCSNSVVYCKFMEDGLFLVCTLDGVVSILKSDSEIATIKFEEEISKVCLKEHHIIIGTNCGSIYMMCDGLQTQLQLLGHYSEVLDLIYHDNKVYSLSSNKLVVFDGISGHKVYDIALKHAMSFSVTQSGDIFCIGKEDEIQIRKGTQILTRISTEKGAECILYYNKLFVVGGSFPYILLIDTAMDNKIFKIQLDIEGINNMHLVGYRVTFSSFCGLVGVGDIRDKDSFVLWDSEIGLVFDFVVKEDKVIIAGEKGMNIIYTT